MLPMVVLRRLDCVLEPTKDAVLQRRDALEAQQMPEAAMDRLLGKAADPNRKHPLYNTSRYTFARLLGDAENIAPNLVSYINGFSPTARRIFERFKFADQIEKLDAGNRLFTVVKAMANVDLHPDRIDNLQMGYLFEHLVMRFNEQANEEAGDHFTPREVIRLMANLVNTGIFTYVWLVTNRKPPERRGKVQLIDGTRFFQKMKKSLNNKRNEITEAQIRHLTRVYGNDQDGDTAPVQIQATSNGETETRVISRIVDNREFGFLKVTVERPLRMNFEATPARIAKLDDQTAFANLAASKKRKDKTAAEREIEEGRRLQDAIRDLLATLEGNGRYMDRAAFEADLTRAAKGADLKLPAPIKKAIFAALGERDPNAEICRDAKGRPEPDSELRDTENIPLPPGTALPLPMDFGPDKPNDRLVAAFRPEIDAYIAREVLPHVPDAWVDYDKTKIGYEIPINGHFYVYKPPRPLDEIEADISQLEGEIAGLLKGLAA